MEQTECSEMSAYKIQTPRNKPKERIQHSEHDNSLKSRSSQGWCGVENLTPLGFDPWTLQAIANH
jgi:hypothetical protein